MFRAVAGNSAGVVGAQVVSFASMAVVARLYSPSDIGFLGLFMSLVSVLTPLGTLSYPNAICFARSNSHAIALATLGLLGALGLGILVSLAGLVTSYFLPNALIQGVVVALGILGAASMSVATQATFRARLIRVRSSVLVLVAIAVASARIIIGWYSPSALGLIGPTIAGFLLTSLLLLVFGLRISFPQVARLMQKAPVRRCARLFDEFPRYTMPHALVRYATLALPTLIFGIVAGPNLAGQYTLAAAVVSAPLLMVSDAVGEAITRPLAQLAERDRQAALNMALHIAGVLSLLVIPLLLLFMVAPQWIMYHAFGPGWELAANFVRILVLWPGAMLISRPLICLIPAFGLQKTLLHSELWFGTVRFAGFLTGLLIMKSPELAVAGFALPGIFLSLLNARRVVNSVNDRPVLNES